MPRTPAPSARPALEPQSSGVTALLQAVSAPSGRVVWVSGHAARVLRSTDGGVTWERLTVPGAAADSLQFRDVQRGASPTFAGAVYGAAIVPGRPGWVMAVGPRGLDYSMDDGRTWTSLDTLAYWSVGFGSSDVGWAVGPNGRITRIVVPR